MLLVLSRRNSYLKDVVVFIPHLTSEYSLNDQFSEEQLLADVMRRARSRTETCMSSFLLKFLVIFEDRVDHVFAFRTWDGMQWFWQMLLSWGWRYQLYNLGT